MSTPTSTTEFASPTTQIRQSIATINRPWRELLDPAALSFPVSLSESTYRIKRNLHYFRFNYTLVTLSILFLSLIYHPISIIVFLITFAAWLYFYLFRSEPLVVFNWIVDDWVVLINLYLVTFIALILTKVWLNVVVAVVIAGFVVCLHAAMRAPEDVDDMETPYGPLLSVVDSPRGGYNRV